MRVNIRLDRKIGMRRFFVRFNFDQNIKYYVSPNFDIHEQLPMETDE